MITPYNDSDKSKKVQVEEMFDSIAWRYDFLNHFLSLGIDRRWRKRAIQLLKPKSPKRILDVATGTGDFALEALSLNPDSVGTFPDRKEFLTLMELIGYTETACRDLSFGIASIYIGHKKQLNNKLQNGQLI